MTTFWGSAGPDTLQDTLASGDTYQGLAGDDTLIAGRGNDQYNGGLNTDIVDYSQHLDQTGWTFNLATLSANREDNNVTVESDVLLGIESVKGTSSSDFFIGDANPNVFLGESGDDSFLISGGADEYFGGAGRWDAVKGDLTPGQSHLELYSSCKKFCEEGIVPSCSLEFAFDGAL